MNDAKLESLLRLRTGGRLTLVSPTPSCTKCSKVFSGRYCLIALNYVFLPANIKTHERCVPVCFDCAKAQWIAVMLEGGVMPQ